MLPTLSNFSPSYFPSQPVKLTTGTGKQSTISNFGAIKLLKTWLSLDAHKLHQIFAQLMIDLT